MTDSETQEFVALYSKMQANLNELVLWKERITKTQTRIVLPDNIAMFDPDPIGAHKMSDQRRLDTAFEEYRTRLDRTISRILKVGNLQCDHL